MFADDLAMILEYDQQCFNEVMYEFSQFENQTAMIVNYDKTMVYRIGSIKHSIAKLYSMKKLIWSDEPITILGIKISNDLSQIKDLNIVPVISKVKNILRIWEQRSLSLFGKIQILNSLIGSLFVYKLTVLPLLQEADLKVLRKIFADFIWNHGKPKLSFEILQGLKKNGEGGLVNMKAKDLALKISWVHKFPNNDMIKNIAYHMIENKIGNIFPKSTIKHERCTKTLAN